MKYKDTGFRAIYKHFCAFMITDAIKPSVRSFPGASKANCILTYGYIDRDAGLTVEILAAGTRSSKGFRFYDGNSHVRHFIRIGAVKDEEFFIFSDTANSSFQKRYADKLDKLKAYDANEEVEKSRGMVFLDGCRDGNNIDDILVYLTRDGLRPEGCWVRINGLGDHCIRGKLLNEPKQDFGVHIRGSVSFGVQKTIDKKIICCCSLSPERKLTAENLEDGSMLISAVKTFNALRTQESFIWILRILRDSYVWVPCRAIFSDKDYESIKKSIEDSLTDANLKTMAGQTISLQDNIRLIPDILQKGERFFFPVFSSTEEMGDYGQRFSKIKMHFLETVPLARNNEKNVAGIVVNAFSVPFVLPKDFFETVEKMDSKIK